MAVSSLSPDTGPAAGGGTAITISGAGIDMLALGGAGSHARCAFSYLGLVGGAGLPSGMATPTHP